MKERFLVFILVIMLLIPACTKVQGGPNKDATQFVGPTGEAELDRIISVVLEGDMAELQPLLGFFQTACTIADGLGGPPKCLGDEEDGSPVEVLPFLGPGEGSFLRKTDLDSWAGVDVSELFAVYQVSEAAYSEKEYPVGEFALVFIGDPGTQTSVTLQVRDGKIVRIDHGFGDPPEIPAENVARYLIAPDKSDR